MMCHDPGSCGPVFPSSGRGVFFVLRGAKKIQEELRGACCTQIGAPFFVPRFLAASPYWYKFLHSMKKKNCSEYSEYKASAGLARRGGRGGRGVISYGGPNGIGPFSSFFWWESEFACLLFFLLLRVSSQLLFFQHLLHIVEDSERASYK
jgi:hypothetical protein